MVEVEVLLVNDTNFPLEYFVRAWEGSAWEGSVFIAPERFNTLYPQSKIMVPTSSGREIILQWIDNGDIYRETYRIENNITLGLAFDPENGIFRVNEWDDKRLPEVEEVKLKPFYGSSSRSGAGGDIETYI